jgi:tRNA A-37 threonylcarbamoyl transferase component Bud32/tetratricopeptide (TPR) repeat protein
MQAIRNELADGRFRIRRPLGKGAMGVVYEAYDEARKARVALKTMQRIEPAGLYRFKKEFRALADVLHPNLVTLHELFADASGTFFTMELVEGCDLLSFVRAEPRGDDLALADTISAASPPQATRDGFDPERLKNTFRQLAEGITALHAARKLHRDLKPSNVLVTAEGRVVILDFGLVESTRPEQQTVEHGVSGTPAYMAPEQAMSGDVTEASDWYAAGVILYEALTGRLPFDGPVMQVLAQKQERDPAPPSSFARVPEDLEALCMALLSRDPALRPGSADVLARLGAASTLANRVDTNAAVTTVAPVFVGRERQLAALREAYRASRAESVVQLVHGAAGMGKSHLVQHFLDEIECQGATLLRGRCFEHESVPYKALDSVVDALSALLRKIPRAEVDALLPVNVQALTRVFPVLLRVEAIAEAPRRGAETPDPQELRRRAARALRGLLERLCMHRPLVIWIDDLQWGDVDSVALLGELVRPPDAPSLLFIGSHRSEEARAPCLDALRNAFSAFRPQLDVRELEVGPLVRTESRELAALLLGPEESAGSAPKLIEKESEGSPFFIEQLVRHLKLQLSERPSYTLNRKLRLEHVLRDRLDTLDDDSRALLEVVAVSGQPVAREVAVEAAGLDGEREMSALALLRAGRWVRTRVAGGRNEVECYHHRLRAAVVNGIGARRLPEVHGALAAAHAASGAADPEKLAHHFAAAGDRWRAGAFAATAAERATEALAFERAAQLWRRSIELRALPAEEARPLLWKLGIALVKAGRGREAALVFLEAAEGAPGDESGQLQRHAAEQLLRSGHIEEGVRALDRVLQANGMRLVVATWLVLLLLLVERTRLLLRGLDYERRAAAQCSPEQLTRLEVCWSVAAMLSIVHPVAARVFETRFLRLALDAGEETHIARGLALEANHSAFGGGRSHQRTAERLDRALRITKRLDEPNVSAWFESSRAITAYLEGRFEVSLSCVDRAIATYRERTTGTQWEISSMVMFGAWSLFHLGRTAELSRRLPLSIQEAREHGNRYLLTNVRIGLCNSMWLAADDVERAEHELTDAMRDWGSPDQQIQQYYELIARAHIDLYRGRGTSALARIDGRWLAMRRAFLFELQLVALEAWHLRARAALSSFDETGDARLLARAETCVRAMEREHMDWSDPLAAIVRGAILAARGQRAAADALLGESAEKLDRLGMILWAAAARWRRGELCGGERGAAFVAEAEAVARAEAIASPEAYFRMLAPGFARNGSGGGAA